MNTQMKALLARKLSKKGKKLNGFTLIELMVVVAIVGVLTAVGLPELSKAQDRAKDNATAATLTNAAKECSLSLISLGDDTDYTGGTADTPFESVTGDCEADTTLSLDLIFFKSDVTSIFTLFCATSLKEFITELILPEL